MPAIPAQTALTALQCADTRGEDVATQAPGHGKHPLAEREASEGTLGLASSSRQLTKQFGDSINMCRAGGHIIIATHFY